MNDTMAAARAIKNPKEIQNPMRKMITNLKEEEEAVKDRIEELKNKESEAPVF